MTFVNNTAANIIAKNNKQVATSSKTDKKIVAPLSEVKRKCKSV